jgi:ABC transporter substrate binding protein
MSYSPNFDDLYRRGAVYVDKILRGAKPADLPVEQATKFELVINMKRAKALGLTIRRRCCCGRTRSSNSPCSTNAAGRSSTRSTPSTRNIAPAAISTATSRAIACG